MKVLDVRQGSQDWFQARCGVPTGSHAADIMGFLKKGGESAARANYRAKIVAEILTGEINMDGYLSPAMVWGSDIEPLARTAYELKTGLEVDTVGFVQHEAIERMGGSPDGLLGEDGIIEIKAPNTSTHLKWMLAGVVPEEHEPQMSFYLAVTGREWADFVSFDPRLPERHQLFVCRLERQPERIAEIEASVVQFNAEVDETIALLEAKNPEIVRPSPAQEEMGDLGLTDADIDAYIPAEFKG